MDIDKLDEIVDEIKKEAFKRGRRRDELNIPGTPDDDWSYAEAKVRNKYSHKQPKKGR